ncbi:MAG: hypothetical protein C4520_02220 [Candidatus Abyssobacteria bacterium SURF_5]|uniref:Radical SAM core domain-containing protein n=1 Tax=Abyssobacteria bacterium (strain SURF_5) TaxID=2093360 RepID=A0A3A4PCA7_ABYX5|nr:MAG: hypothetical protein C4520_02220 [Candidatus Abyssubacteria bacterium SURF_5]
MMGKMQFDLHLQRLKDRFAETPDSIILKADVLREGLRFTADLAEVALWAIPTNAFLSREDIPADEAANEVLAAPNQLTLPDGTRVNLELDKKSPYFVRKQGNHRYVLFRGKNPITEVSSPARPTFQTTLSDGSAVSDFLGQRTENCIAIVHSLFCEYSKNRDQCAFCILGNMMAGLTLSDISDFIPQNQKKTIEACTLAAKEIKIRHAVVSGGSFIKTELEAKSYAKTIAALRKALGPKTRITAVCQAFDEKGWLLLKEAGADRVQPNLEVWEDRLWEEVVPGKTKAVGKKEWIRRLKAAVDIFGPGQVATNFVAGVELLSPNGSPHESDAVESHMRAYEFLVDHAIVPIFGFLTKARGTRYEGMELPSTEFYLELGWKRHLIMQQSGMYDCFPGGDDADFSCYQCVAHKTGQDYRRLSGDTPLKP